MERNPLPPWLTDAEIDDLCKPLTQPAAQVRFLRQVLKLQVSTKPSGRALVIRSHAEAMLSGASPAPAPAAAGNAPQPSPQPNRAALVRRFSRGAPAHGKAAEEQPA